MHCTPRQSCFPTPNACEVTEHSHCARVPNVTKENGGKLEIKSERKLERLEPKKKNIKNVKRSSCEGYENVRNQHA
jgi:hypothetical protein